MTLVHSLKTIELHHLASSRRPTEEKTLFYTRTLLPVTRDALLNITLENY
jgi:hypothetical protein